MEKAKPKITDSIPGWQGIDSIDRLMPMDFVFLLLRLINYPDAPKPTIQAERIEKMRFERMKMTHCVRFLISLLVDTGLELVIDKEEKRIREIIVSDESAAKILEAIEKYLVRFKKGRLIPIEGNSFDYPKQRQYFLKLIQSKVEEIGTKTIQLTDGEIEKGYRLFEGILILEREKMLKIERINNPLNKDTNDIYRIAITPNMKRVRAAVTIDSLAGQRIPYCIEEDGIGYLYSPQSKDKLKISRSSARPYRLLRELAHPFGTAKTVDTVYAAIINGRRKDADKYLVTNKKITTLENTKKELQKIPGFSKIIKIHINKERKIIWLERKSDVKE